jgi:hypothetical protein
MKVLGSKRLFYNLKLILVVCILSIFLFSPMDLRADDPPVPLPDGQTYGTEVKTDRDLAKTNSTTHLIIGVGAIVLVIATGYGINRYFHAQQQS